jgi:L-amino acid N-acyltransferase YncA
VILRLATVADAAGVRAIYAPIVAETAISFEVEPPTVETMRARIAATLAAFPWIVCEHGGEVAGYAYASAHHERAAYRWAVDVSVYVHEAARRRGVGRACYTALFRLLALQGFHAAYAGITLPNPASVALHEALGFEPVGVYRDVGFKLGAWHDVGWWQRRLRERAAPAAPPSPLAAVEGSPAWAAAFAAGAALLAA